MNTAPHRQGHESFLFLRLTLLHGHIRLITCPLRSPDMIMITPPACLEKPQRATASFGSAFVFSPASLWLLMLKYWCCSTDTGITTGKASHSQLFFSAQRIVVVLDKTCDRALMRCPMLHGWCRNVLESLLLPEVGGLDCIQNDGLTGSIGGTSQIEVKFKTPSIATKCT